MLESVATGIVLGLGAGLSPGPLLGLVVLTSLRSGIVGGCRVAASPLFVDIPIVVLTLTLVSALSDGVVSALYLAGGIVVVAFGVMALRDARRTAGLDNSELRPASLWQGALATLLNPHPWLFWIAVGAPVLVRSWRESPLHAIAFLAAFYLFLVGSKAVIAVAVGTTRGRMSPRLFRLIANAAGLLMVAFGAALLLNFVSS